MRFCLEHMSEEQRKEIARSLFVVKEELKGKRELHGLCPHHNDQNNPSFSYSYKKDLCNCMVCDLKGDLIDLWCYTQGKLRDQDGFKAFCETYNVHDPAYTRSQKPSKSQIRKPESGQKPAPPKEKPIEEPKETPVLPWAEFEKLPQLPEEWISRLLKERGWTRDGIRKTNLRLYKHTLQSAKIFKVKMPFNQMRVAIPVPDDAGNLCNVRFYLPWDRGPEDEKILSCAGYGAARLLPPPSAWVPGQPIWNCEGEPDYILGVCLGLNAVTKTTGAKIWKDEWTEAYRDKEVINLYDADKVGLAGNEIVGNKLAPVAKVFRYLRWPKQMYIDLQPKDDPKQKFTEFVLAEGRDLPANHGEDLTDFVIKHKKNVADLKDLLSSAGTVSPPEKLTELGPRRFFAGRNGNAFKPALLAEAIQEDLDVVSDPETSLIYRWNEQFWERYNLAYIRKKALKMLEGEASSARAADVANMVRDLASMESNRRMDDSLEWICLKNCMFNLETGDIAPHAKDYYFSYMLGVDFNPEGRAECTRWLQFLSETIQDQETIKALQEFFGYCLTNDVRYEKCLFLFGPGSDGKSKVLNILQALLGERNCAAVGLKDLEKEFYRASILGKKLNVSAEFDSGAFTSDWFKRLVSGDLVSAAFKHKDFFEFRFSGKMAFASNRFPKVLDNTDGYWRRLLPIQFKRQFLRIDDGKDIGLEKKLLEELDGIFSWALAGLERLYEQQEFTWSEDMERTLQEYKASNDPVLLFCRERLLRHDGDVWRISKAKLYIIYCRYCRDGNYAPLNRYNFGRELKRVMKGLGEGKTQGTPREEAWLGIEVIDFSDDSPSPLADTAPAS